MGGSAFGQVYNNMSGDAPDVDDTGRLKAFYSVIQQLVAEDKLLAYHDRSDGGLFATLAEMAFAGRCGLNVQLDSLTDFAALDWNDEKQLNSIASKPYSMKNWVRYYK